MKHTAFFCMTRRITELGRRGKPENASHRTICSITAKISAQRTVAAPEGEKPPHNAPIERNARGKSLGLFKPVLLIHKLACHLRHCPTTTTTLRHLGQQPHHAAVTSLLPAYHRDQKPAYNSTYSPRGLTRPLEFPLILPWLNPLPFQRISYAGYKQNREPQRLFNAFLK
jgi:hypothetical protein